MKIKKYNSLTPTIRFYKEKDEIYYRYNNKLIKVDNNLELLKEQLILPYKLSFYGLPIEMVDNILKIFNDENNKLFWYREEKNTIDLIIYHAIFLEREKYINVQDMME